MIIEKKSKKNPPTKEEISSFAVEKLEKIISFMLDMENNTDLSEFLQSLLLNSNFIEIRNNKYTLTVNGFRFILEDINTQIHILLLNYIKLNCSSFLHLKLIFQLITTNENCYKINENENVNKDEIKVILANLKRLGLIYQKKKKRFYVTQLMRSFLLGHSSPDSSRSLMSKDGDKGIIVETNFKIY